MPVCGASGILRGMAKEAAPAKSAATTRTDSAAGSSKTTYIVVGVVAAAVSAATAAYIIWSRNRALAPQVETVQDLLEQAHDKMRQIEQKLGDLHHPAVTPSSANGSSATTAPEGSGAAA